MTRTHSLKLIALTALAVSMAACAAESDDGAPVDEEMPDIEGEELAEQDVVSASEAKARCEAVPARAPMSAAEQEKLFALVMDKAFAIKRANDALIRERGAGSRVGVRTPVMLMRNEGRLRMEDPMPNPVPPEATRFAKAAALLQKSGKLKPGVDAMDVVKGLTGTSCIGFTYEVLRHAYKQLGRESDFAKIEACSRAKGSIGLYFQQALIKNGWPAPTLGFVSDANKAPSIGSEAQIHRAFLSSAAAGSYYGTPISKGAMMRNFLPLPGSNTAVDNSLLVEIGKSKFIGIGTFRAGYHVPLMFSASMVPSEYLTTDAQRSAKARGEIFMIESHTMKEAWDPNNFEVRPLKEAIAETYKDKYVYSTGNILFAPGSTFKAPK